jgi:hypothetical protein
MNRAVTFPGVGSGEVVLGYGCFWVVRAEHSAFGLVLMWPIQETNNRALGE